MLRHPKGTDAVPPKAEAPPLIRSFLALLWRTPLLAAPFALFFGTLYGAKPAAYREAYLDSLLFAFVISLTIWALEQFVVPLLRRPSPRGRPLPPWVVTAAFAAASLTGTFIAALIGNYTIMPGILGSARAIAIVGMFAVLFSGLFLGIISAVTFYRKAIDKARAEEELDLARRIQRSFLISSFPQRPRFEVHAVNLSSRQVSGDFYDVVPAVIGRSCSRSPMSRGRAFPPPCSPRCSRPRSAPRPGSRTRWPRSCAT